MYLMVTENGYQDLYQSQSTLYNHNQLYLEMVFDLYLLLYPLLSTYYEHNTVKENNVGTLLVVCRLINKHIPIQSNIVRIVR